MTQLDPSDALYSGVAAIDLSIGSVSLGPGDDQATSKRSQSRRC